MNFHKLYVLQLGEACFLNSKRMSIENAQSLHNFIEKLLKQMSIDKNLEAKSAVISNSKRQKRRK